MIGKAALLVSQARLNHFSIPAEKPVTNTLYCCQSVAMEQWSQGFDSALLHYYASEIIFYFVKAGLSSLKFWPSGCVLVWAAPNAEFVIMTLPWGLNSHSAQRKLNYASFYSLCGVQGESEGTEKLGSLPEMCSKLWYWILYYAVLLFGDILSDHIFALRCYNCVWLRGSNINDPNIYDSQNVLY